MSRRVLLAVVVAFVVLLGLGLLVVNSAKGQVCLSKNPGNLLGCVLAGPVAVTVQVSGNVDAVAFYSTDDPSQPAAKVATNGKDTNQVVSLPTYALYYFVTRKGSQEYRSRTFGFDTNQARANLTIQGLNQWEMLP